MLVEGGTGTARGSDPDTLQALIAARIDHLAPPAKTLLQRASVVGRVFYRGAIDHLSPDLDDVDALLDDLLQRELLLREPRSSISGEAAYRFKHFLIREVAYTGLAKLARAQHHARFAEWLAERSGDELLEIRAYHLDQAVELLTELESPPEQLAEDAAGALVKAAKRAIARESYATARKLGLALSSYGRRSALLGCPGCLEAAGLGGGAGGDGEGPRPGSRARRARRGGARADRARRGVAQADADPERAKVLVDEALEPPQATGRPACPLRRARRSRDGRCLAGRWTRWCGSWSGRTASRSTPAARTCRRSPRRRSPRRIIRLELDEAELLLTRALELAGESGSVRARVRAALSYGWFLTVKGEIDAAETPSRSGTRRRPSSASSPRSRARSPSSAGSRGCVATTSAPRSCCARPCA